MTRTASPRLGAYAALAALGLLAALALGRAELVVLAAPFAVFVALAVSLGQAPSLRFAFALSDDRVIEGAPVDATLELSSSSALDRVDFAVAIDGHLMADPAPVALGVSLSGDLTRGFPFVLRAARWGAYEPGAVTFRVHDRLDVFTYEGLADCAVSLRVYPELERLRHLVRPFLTQPFAGSQIARSKGEGIEFADIRPFQYGDQVRRVNWRASARHGEMLLTESNPERTADVVLLLDGYADVRSVEGGTLDSLVRAAASLAQGHLAQRDRVGVITFGAQVTWLVPGLGDRQLYQIVESLIETAVARSYRWANVDLLPPRTLPPQALLIALTPLTDRRTVRALFDLRARGFDMVVVEVSPLAHLRPAQDEPAALGHRLWMLSREALRFRFEQLGVPVSSWTPGNSLAREIEEVRAYRRFAHRVRG